MRSFLPNSNLFFLVPVLLVSACTQTTESGPDSDALITIEWILPEAETVQGTVQIRIEAFSHADVKTLVITEPAGILDTNDDPAIFEADWDTTTLENGPTLLDALAIDGKGRSATANIEVIITNTVPVEGFALLATPVQSATIEAFFLDEKLQPVEEVAVTTTDEAGHFSFSVPLSSSASHCLFRATGSQEAHYDTESTPSFFDLDDRLIAIISIEDLPPEGPLYLHGWTTMAGALAQAYVANGTDANDAVDKAYERVGEHLWRPLNQSLLMTQPSFPNEEEFDVATPGAAIGLTHIGFTEIARQWSKSAGIPVKVIDVITYLSLDLSDGYFNGFQQVEAADPAVISVGNTHPLHADNTRTELAQAIYSLVTSPLRESLVGPDALLATLAKDEGPLYLPEDPPGALSLGPGLYWTGDTPDEGAFVKKSFQATVSVIGPEEVASLEILSPGAAQWTESSGTGGVLIVDTGTLEDGPILLMVEGKDNLGNLGTLARNIHLDRTGPVLELGELGVDGWFYEEEVILAIIAYDTSPGNPAGVGVDTVILQDTEGGSTTMNSGEGDLYKATTSLSEGEHLFTVEATDFLGNTASMEFTIGRDTQAPALQILSPGDGDWVNQTHPNIAGEVFDSESGVASVTLINVNTEEEQLATLLDAGGWEGPAPAELLTLGDHFTLRVKALDAVGNFTEITVELAFDPEPPSLTVDPHPPVVWTSDETLTVSGTLLDGDGSGALAIKAINGEIEVTSEAIQADGNWTLSLPMTTFGVTEWVLTGMDLAGNLSESILYYAGLDQFPPVILPDQGSDTPMWTNTTDVTVVGIATDDGIGVAKVFAQVCSDATSLCSEVVLAILGTENGDTTFSATLTLPGVSLIPGAGGEGAFTLSIWAEDLLEKTSAPLEIPTYFDITAPSLELGTETFYDETEETVAFSSEGLPLYLVEGGTAHIIDEDHCAPNCGTFQKFPHRFTSPGLTVNSPKESFKEINAPIFTPVAVDNALVMNPNAALQIEARFSFEGPGTGGIQEWQNISESTFVATASPFLWPGTTVVTGEIPLPDGVTLRATDPAGNATERFFSFQISLNTPPLRNVESLEAPLSFMDDSPLDFEAGNVQWAFQYSNAMDIRVGQLIITNPYPMSIAVRYEHENIIALSALAETTGKRTYLGKFEWPDGMPTPCITPGECQYAYGGEIDPVCDIIDGNATVQQSINGGSIDGFEWFKPATNETSTALAGDMKVLGPGETIHLNLATSFAGSCLVGAPVEFNSVIWEGSAYIHPYEPTCNQTTLSAFTADTALCMDQELGPDCLINPTGCLIETIYSHHFPPVVTALSVTGYLFPENIDQPSGLRFTYSTPMGEDTTFLIKPSMDHSLENTATAFKSQPGLTLGGD